MTIHEPESRMADMASEVEHVLMNHPDPGGSNVAIMLLAGTVNRIIADIATLSIRITEMEAGHVQAPDASSPAEPPQEPPASPVRWKLVHDGRGEWYCIPVESEELFHEMLGAYRTSSAESAKTLFGLFAGRFKEYCLGCVVSSFTFEKPVW